MAVALFHKHYPNPSSDRYLIILHGLFGMLDNWHNMAKLLSAYLNVVTVDQRNHGHSPHTESMDFEVMAQDLDLLLQKLQIEQAVILGHSMGGKTAMRFADLFPHRVERLIVVDIAPRAYHAGHEQYFRAFESLDLARYSRRSEVDRELARTEPNLAIRQFLLKNLERAETGFRFKFNLPPIIDFYPKMIDSLPFEWIIPVPTLFIYGGRSGYIREEDKDRIVETFPSAEFVEIPEAGHWVHAEQPQLFHNAVKSFLGYP